jgi:RNase H-fold protein (predicted Holliday junction resolvase)
MKFAAMLSVSFLVLTQNLSASAIQSTVEVAQATPDRVILAQHLWDEEWSTPVIHEGVDEEVLMLDEVETEEGTTVAKYFWRNDNFQGDSQELNNGLELAQHLWDEEWSTPVANEELNEEVLMLEEVGAEQGVTVAHYWWDNGNIRDGAEKIPSQLDITQHLWDEEWSAPQSAEQAPLNEALLLNAEENERVESVAAFWWKDAIEESPSDWLDQNQLLSQHLWDEEWAAPTAAEPKDDEVLMLEEVGTESESAVAHYWWDNGNVQEESTELAFKVEQLAQHLWDEEWSTPSENREFEIDEALLLDTPKMDESQLIAGSIWNIAVKERAVS